MASDTLDRRPDHVMRCMAALRVRPTEVPDSVQSEIADSLVDDRDYLEQVRWALIARGYLPKPEKPNR